MSMGSFKSRHVVLFALAGTLLLSGCAGTVGGNAVMYQDPTSVDTMNTDWGRTDINAVAERMVNSLIRHPLISGGARPVMQVSTLRNKTTEHLDVKSITDKIRTALIKTGMVRFTAASDANRELQENLEYQNNSGMVNSNTAKAAGRQIGTGYLLYGEIGSIIKTTGRVTETYYKLTLNMVDVETGIIEWADEKEILKRGDRSLFGR